MNKLSKSAVSAAAAAFLLLGGASSLAYWSDSTAQAGTSINTGHLKLVVDDAGQWKLNSETTAFNSATQRVVPGDTLTKVAQFSIDGEGDYLQAEFTAATPAWAGSSASAFTNELTVNGSYQVSSDNGSTWSAPFSGVAPTSVANGDLVRATLTVTFPGASATNGSNVAAGLSAALNDVAVTVTQVR